MSCILPRRQSVEWNRRVDAEFPHGAVQSIWAFSRSPPATLPRQGWKIHVSCTVLNCNSVLEAVARTIGPDKIYAKTARRLRDIGKLNAGIFFGYSQVGKIFTIYPPNTDAFIGIAHALADALVDVDAPAVPFDFIVPTSRCVFYRYGAFLDSDVITSPDGQQIPDDRYTCAAPTWAPDPFHHALRKASKTPSPDVFALTPIYKCLAQRGRGGVYLALDLRSDVVKRVVIKSGRHWGEVDWDGTDGAQRIQIEAEMLDRLSAIGIAPKPLGLQSGERGIHLLEEYIEGKLLADAIASRQLTAHRSRQGHIIRTISRNLERTHRHRIAWRDLKPHNIILRQQKVFFVDFEGAVRVPTRTSPRPWGTPDFAPPEWQAPPRDKASLAHDIYSFGATIERLIGRRLVDGRYRSSAARPRIDRGYLALVRQMKARHWIRRPTAQQVVSAVFRLQKPRRRPAASHPGRRSHPKITGARHRRP